jgi:prepilin-type N-terminal cleavage/methylation domain-containing protein
MVSPRRNTSGFTLIELLVVIAIIMIIALFGFPALDKAIQRARLESAARTTGSLMQMARINAIKRSTGTGVAVRFATHRITAFFDTNANQTYEEGTDTAIASQDLAKVITFWGPGDGAEGGTNALNAFYNENAAGGEIYFNADGSLAADPTEIASGEKAFNGASVRFRGARDNYVEAAVTPPTTARVVVRKYVGSGAANVAANWKSAADGWTWE